MRLIRYLTGTLLAAGMAGYAWTPAHAAVARGAALMSNPATLAAAQQDQTKPPKQDKEKPPKETRQQKPSQAENQEHPQHQEKPNKKEQKEQRKQESRDQKQERQGHGQPAGRHARIPDRDFKAHFGRPHHFRVRQVITTTRIVPNQTQFVYGGYTFVFLDPWPDDWDPDDDCYIDYEDDEYVLIDVAHPGVTIALSVVM